MDDIPHRVETILIDFVFEISFKSSPSEWMWMQERNSIMGWREENWRFLENWFSGCFSKPCLWSCTRGSSQHRCDKVLWRKEQLQLFKSEKLNGQITFKHGKLYKLPFLGNRNTKACQSLLWHYHVKLFKAIQSWYNQYQNEHYWINSEVLNFCIYD